MADAVPPKAWREYGSNCSKWTRPFLRIEWLTEWAVYRLNQWAFIELAKQVASLSIVWVAFTYVLTTGERRQAAEDQRKSKHYQAWQIVNSAQGKNGDGGRIEALQDLVRDGISLSHLDVSPVPWSACTQGTELLQRSDLVRDASTVELGLLPLRAGA
jgi:hypothetical protein